MSCTNCGGSGRQVLVTIERCGAVTETDCGRCGECDPRMQEVERLTQTILEGGLDIEDERVGEAFSRLVAMAQE